MHQEATTGRANRYLGVRLHLRPRGSDPAALSRHTPVSGPANASAWKYPRNCLTRVMAINPEMIAASLRECSQVFRLLISPRNLDWVREREVAALFCWYVPSHLGNCQQTADPKGMPVMQDGSMLGGDKNLPEMRSFARYTCGSNMALGLPL